MISEDDDVDVCVQTHQHVLLVQDKLCSAVCKLSVHNTLMRELYKSDQVGMRSFVQYHVSQNEGEALLVSPAGLSERRVSMATATWATPACTRPRTAMNPQRTRSCRQTLLPVATELGWPRRCRAGRRVGMRGGRSVQGRGRTSRVGGRGGE